MVRSLTSKAVVTGFLQRQRLFGVIATPILSMVTVVMFSRISLIVVSATIK